MAGACRKRRCWPRLSRAAGIPARVGYADVRNHLSTERMRKIAGTDLYIWHGYTEMWLDGAWVKATPAFNLTLCERFGILPLDWDGRSDSLYHPYDRAGRHHMEYVNQRGSFDDVPAARINADFTAMYPALGRQCRAGRRFREGCRAREPVRHPPREPRRTGVRLFGSAVRGRRRPRQGPFHQPAFANSQVTLDAPPSVQR